MPTPNKADDAFRAHFYEQVSRLGKALSSPQRLVILNVLCQGERSVEALAAAARLTVPNASKHLQALRSARLVEARRSGNHIIYAVASDHVVRCFEGLKHLAAEQLAEVREAMAELRKGRPDTVTRDELVHLVRTGSSLILDVRPVEEWTYARIPGTRCIPLGELPGRLSDLPTDREIVALCRGPYCVLADQAVTILRSAGFLARRADDGVVQWRLAGLPVERPGEEVVAP